MRALAFSIAGALIGLAMWAQVASACSCVRAHPAGMLAGADGALVGVVESQATSANGSRSYVIRVERAVKGQFGERATIHSGLTSCQVQLADGQRVGLVLTTGAAGEWSAGACGVTDPDALIAAGELPTPRGTASFVAAVDGAGLDSVALDASGKPAAYGGRDGRPLAVSGCGKSSALALRTPDGKVAVTQRWLPALPAGTPTELPLTSVGALGCSASGNTIAAAGTQDGRTVVVAVRRGKLTRLYRGARAGAPLAIAASRAYIASRGRVDVVTLATGRVRTIRHAGTFEQISVRAGQIAGTLRGGGVGMLGLRPGPLRTGDGNGPLAWLDPNHLLDATNGRVLNTRLRPVRRISGAKGRVIAVENGAAYFADGPVLRRLARGASRVVEFARLPGDVVGLTSAAASASAAAWHSCEKSAKKP